MYIVRDIFNLKYGHYRPVKALLDEAAKKNLMPPGNNRVLSDFTGNAYRLIMESEFDSLTAYEKMMSSETGKPELADWYKQFTEHVMSGHREILKVIK